MQHEHKGPIAVSTGSANSSTPSPQMLTHKPDTRQQRTVDDYARGVHVPHVNNPADREYGKFSKTCSQASSFSPPQSSVIESGESVQGHDCAPSLAGRDSLSSVDNRSMKGALEELESALFAPDGDGGESVESAGDDYSSSSWTELHFNNRMSMAGFQPRPLSSYVNDTIRMLLESYSKKYTLKEEGGALLLGWCNRPLVAASAWH